PRRARGRAERPHRGSGDARRAAGSPAHRQASAARGPVPPHGGGRACTWERGVNAVNLLPAKHRPRTPTGEQQGSAYIVVGVLGGLLLMVVLYVLTVNGINSRKGQVASANAETAAAQRSEERRVGKGCRVGG